ncbi:MAG: hypothetical protein ACR2MA_10190 [Egibacteraceae bacterium]
MTRDAGQLTPRQAVIGLLGLALLFGALVAGLDWLLPRSERIAALEAPAERQNDSAPGVVSCPSAIDLPSQPIDVSASDVIDCPDVYDGRRVRYTGEVVNAVLLRDDRAWLQVNDDLYALVAGPLPEHRTGLGGNSGLGVSVPVEAARSIERVGSRRTRGDVVRLEGVYLKADPHDGGVPAVRADRVVVVEHGYLVRQATVTRRLLVAGALLLASALAVGAWARSRPRRVLALLRRR